MQIGSVSGWCCRFLLDFNLTPYQAPQHHWYWYFRWVFIILAVRVCFWAISKLPKENKSSERSISKQADDRSSRPIHGIPAIPVGLVDTEPVIAAQILVLKDGQQLGPFSVEEINRQLLAKAFESSDLAWHEGLTEWQPLSSITGVAGGYKHGLRPPPPPARTASPASSLMDSPSAPASKGLLVGGYICAAASLLFLPPVLGLAGIICGVVVIKRQQANQGIALLVTSFVCAVFGMIIGAAS